MKFCGLLEGQEEGLSLSTAIIKENGFSQEDSQKEQRSNKVSQMEVFLMLFHLCSVKISKICSKAMNNTDEQIMFKK